MPANVGPEVDFVWKAAAVGGVGIDCLPERGHLSAEPCGVPQDKSGSSKDVSDLSSDEALPGRKLMRGDGRLVSL